MHTRRRLLVMTAVIALAGAAGPALAQNYPDKPVRMIVPWPPGGGTDIFARLIGQKLTVAWGQQVVVENRPGAAGNIGAAAAAKASADGYTIMLATITLATAPSLYKSLPFDPQKDFAPITLVANVPHLLVVNPSVPANSVEELIALAKAKPGQLNYASAGVGSPFHVAAELFKYLAKVDLTHVPYKGGGPAVADTISGQTQVTFANLVAVLPHVKAGRLRALGITTPERSKAAPDIPTIAEAGVPGYAFGSWFGFFAPAGTPKEIVNKLNADMVTALKSPDISERLTKDGADLVADSPEAFTAFVASETDRLGKVIKAAGITAE